MHLMFLKKAPIQKILKENLACDQNPKKPRQFIENVLCKKGTSTYNIEIVVLRENKRFV